MQLSHPTFVGLRVRNPATMGERDAIDLRPTSRILQSLPPLTLIKTPPHPGALQLVGTRARFVTRRQSVDHGQCVAWASGSCSRVCSRAAAAGACGTVNRIRNNGAAGHTSSAFGVRLARRRYLLYGTNNALLQHPGNPQWNHRLHRPRTRRGCTESQVGGHTR